MDSWGKFIDNYLITSVVGNTTVVGACDHGALIGGDGTIWAATQGFSLNASSKVDVAKDDGTTEKITINEFEHIKDAVVNKGDALKMKKGGVHFGGHKFIVTDGFQGEGYYTQYFKSNEGGAAVTLTIAGNYIIGTWNSSKNASVTKDGNTKNTKQSVGFCNNAVDELSKVLVQSGL
jgi:hypothetical protein